MAQFDVHRNPGRNRADIPFLVVIQSRRFDASRARIVAALRLGRDPPDDTAGLTPGFRVESLDVYLDPLQIASIPTATLGPVIASLAADASSDRIIAAIEAVTSRAYG